MNCPSCGVESNSHHHEWCDIQQCPRCGLILGNCPHVIKSADRMPWSGIYPNEADCRRLGFFAKLIIGLGWVPCEKDDPNAHPDLNTLYRCCVWNKDKKQWERK